MNEDKCMCKAFIYRDTGQIIERKLIIHLYGCPTSKAVKEYEALPWYKKLYTANPSSFYNFR